MGQKVDERTQFDRVLSHFDTAMLVTQSQDGSLRSRPMALADNDENGDLWFVTALDAPKVDELLADDRAAAAMQSATRFLSVSGRASIVRDPDKLRRLWRPAYNALFPKGIDDPNVALVRLRSEVGEYWDNHGVKGVKYILRAAKSIARGERAPEPSGPEQHGKVRL
jgi:general stress protein 26